MKLRIAFLSICATFSNAHLSDNFFTSFIQSYDLTGRYTHEYHPFILKKTHESFLELEKEITDSGIHFDGHRVIIGYQEDAVSRYKTKFDEAHIADEVIVKNHAGICSPNKNVFGFITGFLLKDVHWLEKKWFPLKSPLIDHIMARHIEIFDDHAVFFQKHAFGKDYDSILQNRNYIERAVFTQDAKKVLNSLIDFWSSLYQDASKTGSNEAVGTQDMIFSIDYARALVESEGQIKKIYVGPDITYPIEVLAVQKKQATVHAQKFLKKCMRDMQPIENQNTAYVFCSFVDGVGKSTLLNNIKNYTLFGGDIERYNRCDNSSSQEAEIFKLKESVFLVDLPAQMSHYAIKPDGFVFMPLNTVKRIGPAQIEKINDHILAHQDELIRSFHAKLDALKPHMDQRALYDGEDPIDAYACNVLFLGASRLWIPFELNKHVYLFNSQEPEIVKILVSIASVHSTGLKTVEPEQMLFSKGLSMPMAYADFKADLRHKLKKCDIKHVVFINFLSMYPRTSRENIRINFNLQYLKKIFSAECNLDHTVYRHMAYKEQEICHLLVHHYDSFKRMLKFETILRAALYTICKDEQSHAVHQLQGAVLEKKLKEAVEDITAKYMGTIEKELEARLLTEQQLYMQRCALDRIYQTIVNFSFEPLCAYSNALTSLYSQVVQDQSLNQLWHYDPRDGSKDMTIKYTLSEAARDEDLIGPIFRCLRSQWYASLSQLLYTQSTESGLIVQGSDVDVPPIHVSRGTDGLITVMQKNIPLVDAKKAALAPPLKYHIIEGQGKSRSWGILNDRLYYLTWENPGTFFGLFAYDYILNLGTYGQKNTISDLVQQFKKETALMDIANGAMPTALLYQRIVDNNLLSQIKSEMVQQVRYAYQQRRAAPTGLPSGQKINNHQSLKVELIKADHSIDDRSIVDDPRLEGIRLWARAIATLEMILKDPQSEIITRTGNRDDFIACIRLLELVTLTKYYGIQLEEPLFADYSTVEPIIPLEFKAY